MANELILVVEDDAKSRELVRDLLEFHGYSIAETGNAEEALRLAKDLRPALILMDYHLPGMNGIEALKRLRAEEATRGIPVIAVTASVMSENRQRIIDAGFDGLQSKPIHVREFAQTVKDALAQGASASKTGSSS